MEKIAIRAITAIVVMFSLSLFFEDNKEEDSIEINPLHKGNNPEKKVLANELS